jgi:hypothetical protein
MTISIRTATREDAAAITKIHYDAVHITAAQDYDLGNEKSSQNAIAISQNDFWLSRTKIL